MQILKDEEDIATPEPNRFTSKGLAVVFAMTEEGLTKFETEDPDIARYTNIVRGIMDIVQCYKEI